MLIHNNYLNVKHNQFSDEEYMVNQLWFLKHIFYDEIAAILDNNRQYLGLTNRFGDLFDCSSEILGHTFSIYRDSSLSSSVEKAEQEIINKKLPNDSVCQIKQNGQVKLYLIRKRPIINSATGNCLGIFTSAALLNLATHSNIIYRIMSGRQNKNEVILNEQLSDEQHQIVACLLMGFHQRKEIASILHNITNKEYSERQIKYYLTKLYQQYNCSTISELIELIINSTERDLKLPAFSIPETMNELNN